MLLTEDGPAGLKITLNVRVHVPVVYSTGQDSVIILCKCLTISFDGLYLNYQEKIKRTWKFRYHY